MKITIGKKLWILCGIGVVAIVFVYGTSSFFIGKLVERSQDTTSKQLPLIQHSLNISIGYEKVRAAVFRGIFASQIQIEEELATAKNEMTEAETLIQTNIESLKKISSSSDFLELTIKTKDDIDSYLKTANEIFGLLKQNKTTFALELQADFQTKFDTLRTDVRQIDEKIKKSVETSLEATSEIVSMVGGTTKSISVFAIIITLVSSFFIIRDLLKTLINLIERLTDQESAALKYTVDLEEISKSLQESTSQQASAITETAASLSEINAMIQKSSEHSEFLANNSKKSMDAATNGVAAVKSMFKAMGDISASNQQMMERLQEGNKRILSIMSVIKQIGERTKIINDIVFQTKLLSFNASVEAARAGEHGKGFSVVAQEIGSLAKLSGESSLEINKMLEAGTKQVSDIISMNNSEFVQVMEENAKHIQSGTVIAAACGESLDVLAKQVGDVSALTVQISEAMVEQKTGIDEIGKSVDVFSSSANSTASNSDQAAQVSNKLKDQFSFLHELIEELQKNVMAENQRISDNVDTVKDSSAKLHAA